MFQFPVQGLTYDDCFFAKENREAIGRKYVGLYGSAAPSSASASIFSFAAFVYAVKALKVESEAVRDPYWTNLCYFGSMRELGQAATWYIADIKERLEVIYRNRLEVVDPKDFELYKGIRKKSYTREDYLETTYGFEETNDDLNDGRSVPYSKSVVIFDKTLRKNAKSLEDIQSVIVESETTASGEYIERDKFPGLDWSEGGMFAECVSCSEMNLETREIKEKCYICELTAGEMVLKEHEAAKWLARDELDTVDWLPADRGLIEGLKELI